MDFKEIFEKAENGTLTFEQFQEATKGMKLVDLKSGEYVSKGKYDDDLAAKDTQLNTLNETLSTRDLDLANLKAQLEAAGTDSEKLTTLSTDMQALQSKYDADVKSYKEQLKKQQYEFAVKEFANGQKFTSNAAKRDFINSMIAKGLKMEDDGILGANDFVVAYSRENEDAFYKEPEPQPEVQPEKPKPTFVNPTQGAEPDVDPTGGFLNAFSFQGVRPKE